MKLDVCMCTRFGLPALFFTVSPEDLLQFSNPGHAVW